MVLATTHTADWTVFVIASIVVLAGGLGVVAARNPVHSVLFLIQTLFGVAVLFVAQGAHFLAAVQVIVYAGAIVVLFLFVIMLLGVDKTESMATDALRGQRPLAVLVGVIGLAEFAGLIQSATWASGTKSLAGQVSGPGSNVEKLGRSLFSGYLLSFEVTSALLVIAVVAAVVLTRRPHPGTDDDAVDEQAVDEVPRAGPPRAGPPGAGPPDGGPPDGGPSGAGLEAGQVSR
jgi:NADH-quinone oxidoreductase subunit J